MADRLVVLLDQNVPRAVVGWLQEIRPSWDVHHVTTVGLLGKSDLEVFQWAQSQAAMIITFDEDFADRRSFSIGEHPFLSQERYTKAFKPRDENATRIAGPDRTSQDQPSRPCVRAGSCCASAVAGHWPSGRPGTDRCRRWTGRRRWSRASDRRGRRPGPA